MSNVDAAIRERLAGISRELDDDCNMQCGASCASGGYGDVAAAVLAVLDVHVPREVGLDDDVSHICTQCYFNNVYPCPTVREIAEKLGVEAPGG